MSCGGFFTFKQHDLYTCWVIRCNQEWFKVESIRMPGTCFSSLLFGIVVAVWLNWNNSRLGYWLNLIVVTAADLGFIFYVLVPGYVPLIPAGLGPLLWVLAIIFSTLGIMKSNGDTPAE